MRLTKTVGQYLVGRGAFDSLDQIVDERVENGKDSVVYLVDHFFRDKGFDRRLPKRESDLLIYVDTSDEPTTGQADELTDHVRDTCDNIPVMVAGIGGGSTLDLAKAVSNLLTNEGKASDYQGWDLLQRPGVFKVGIPTLSGTGAESSRTCVMMNQAKNLKLGMNSDHTVFDRLVLDPDLTATVERNQYFYSGLDTYIHCIESLNGRHRHPMSDTFSRQALDLCRAVFLSEDMQSDENREKLMIASYLGGSAIGNSLVGVVHPFSAGLSMVLGLHHCIANCIVMNVMQEFYPRETEEFHGMLDAQGIDLPKGVCADLDDAQYRRFHESTLVHEKPLANALGDGFRDLLTFDRTVSLFQRM